MVCPPKIGIKIFHRNQKDVGMALAYKVHIQGGSDNTAPLPNNHPYISSCKLQLAEFYCSYSCMYGWLCGNGAVLSSSSPESSGFYQISLKLLLSNTGRWLQLLQQNQEVNQIWHKTNFPQFLKTYFLVVIYVITGIHIITCTCTYQYVHTCTCSTLL